MMASHKSITYYHTIAPLPLQKVVQVIELALACWIDGRFKEDAWIFSSGRVPSNYVFVHLFSTFSLQK